MFLIFVHFFPALAWHLQQWASSFGSETEVWLDFARERLKQSLFVHSEIIEFLELSCEVALASLGVTHAITLLLAMQPLLRLLPHDLFAVTHNRCHLVCQRVEERLGSLRVLNLSLVA